MRIKNNVPYVSTEVCDKALKIAVGKFQCRPEEVGLLWVELRKEPYTKRGIEYVRHAIDFMFFDTRLRKMGVVTRQEIQRFCETQKQTT